MIVVAIGNDALTVGQLLDRCNQAGTNMSYYLQQLKRGDYLERVASKRDKRSAQLRLSAKGLRLCADLNDIDELYHRFIDNHPSALRDLETTFQTLQRMDDVFGRHCYLNFR